jgi:hypothetical protein
LVIGWRLWTAVALDSVHCRSRGGRPRGTMAMSQLTQAHRKVTGAGLMALVLAAGCAGVGFALGAPTRRVMPAGASAVNRPAAPLATSRRGAGLSIRARPVRGAVIAGRGVAFRVRIARALLPSGGRGHLAAWIWLGVTTRLPAGVSATFKPSATRGSTATLTFSTKAGARRGVYRVRLNAHGRFHRVGRYRGEHAYTFVTLTVTSPPSRQFTIAGSTAALLVPGGAAVIDLRLINPGAVALRVSHLAVGITGVRAPLADRTHPCTVRDFGVSQFSGDYGFTVPGSSTWSLARLGFAQAQWPRLLMLDRPANQDGCKQATLELSFAGASTGGP